MSENQLSTEKRILEAAKTVFHKKGFDGARMQEIADEAGINKALLHYYFRSKENLFDAVFSDAFTEFFRRLFSLISDTIPLDEKIRYICNDYITFMQQNPFIPVFILNGIQHNPEKVAALLQNSPNPPSAILKQVKIMMEAEGLHGIDHRQLIINIISLSVFPLVAKPLLKNILNLSEEEFSDFIEVRKRELPELILRSIHKE